MLHFIKRLTRGRVIVRRRRGKTTVERLVATPLAGVRDAGRVVEILTAITNNRATAEQLHTLVQLPSGAVKFWADVTPEELTALRRAHAF